MNSDAFGRALFTCSPNRKTPVSLQILCGSFIIISCAICSRPKTRPDSWDNVPPMNLMFHNLNPFLLFSSSIIFKTKTNYVGLDLFAHHIAVQSKCTINHFDGLNASESAFWMPFNHTRYSGQMNAEPAYAASTCSQTLCFTQTDPIWKMVTINISNSLRTHFHAPFPTSSKLSNAQAPVVPSVAQTCRNMEENLNRE